MAFSKVTGNYSDNDEGNMRCGAKLGGELKGNDVRNAVKS